jgi:hypothetical protein
MYEYMQVEMESVASSSSRACVSKGEMEVVYKRRLRNNFWCAKGQYLSYVNPACMPGETREIILGSPWYDNESKPLYV